MANTASARKRARQAETRRQHNAGQKSAMRTSIKQVRASVSEGDQVAAGKALQTATSVIDKAAGKGLMHKNRAARYKSKLSALVKTMAASK